MLAARPEAFSPTSSALVAETRIYFLAVLSFMSGIVLGSVVTVALPITLFLFVLGLIFVIAQLLSSRHTYLLLGILFIACALGLVRVGFVSQHLQPAFTHLIGSTTSLSGQVVAVPDVRETNQHITVEVKEGSAATHILANVPLWTRVEVGDLVQINGKLTVPQPFATDGGRTFDYPKYLAKDGIFLLMQQASLTVQKGPTGGYVLLAYLADVREVFARGIETALPEPYAALAEGILTGGKQGLGKELLADFTVSGLVQVVVLSGYNVMIVAQFVLLFLRPFPKRVASIVAALSIVLFVLAAGAGTSAIRAGIMACLALYAKTSGRTYNALRALFAALVLMLLWNPLLLVNDPGLQLSVLATLGLILGSTRIELSLVCVRSALLREAVATTLAAQIAVLPILLYDTGNLSLVSLPANVLVMAVTPFAMAASLVAGIVGMMLPILAPVFALPAYILLYYITAVAHFSAALPFAQIIVPAFSFWFVVVAYAVLLAVVYMQKRVGVLLRPVSPKTVNS